LRAEAGASTFGARDQRDRADDHQGRAGKQREVDEQV